MLNNNLLQNLKYRIFNKNTNSVKTLKSYNGEMNMFTWSASNNYYLNYCTTKNNHTETLQMYYNFPIFGNGVNGVPTEVSENDYCLDSLVEDLTVSQFVNMVDDTYGTNSIGSYLAIVENRTDTPITVCELGVCVSFAQSVWDDTKVVMMHREVFEPVTIQPGEAFTFTINFK